MTQRVAERSEKSPPTAGPDIRRWIVLVLSLTMLVGAGIAWLSSDGTDASVFWIGVFMRVGTVLLTLFLAWPTLARLKGTVPNTAVVLLLVVVAVIAIRPRLFPVAVGLVALGIAIHLGLRFISRTVR